MKMILSEMFPGLVIWIKLSVDVERYLQNGYKFENTQKQIQAG